ncbi:DUF3592 domain-containing protein [Mesorhizobium sp.]|uniref:DUF3592 domain-containing protein n=1 Tax=Mesorhizobium sp. TaxID=1871066 RepID=UPI0025CFB5F5|nr:DUF3592 domain-containing protein [Mesorhizobium sp.]
MRDEQGAEEKRRRGGRVLLAGVALAILALAAWSGRGWVSSWFASSYEGSVSILTIDEPDETRLNRAFEQARLTTQTDAKLTIQDADSHFRHATVTVTAPTAAQAIAAAKALSDSMTTAFGDGGPGHISTEARRVADPLPNGASETSLAAFAFGAPLAGLIALVLILRGWPGFSQDLPRGSGLLAGTSAALAVAIVLLPGWAVMALFGVSFFAALAGKIVYNARLAETTALWPSARGRIVRSGMRTARRSGTDAPRVGNVPSIEYVYDVGGVEYRGHRIRAGDIIPDSAEATAAPDRYRVGREGPVYYNPVDPKDAVLEQGAPLRTTTAYAGAAATLLIGAAAVVFFMRIGDVIALLQPYFPEGAVVQGALFFGAAGLLALVILVSDYRQASAAARWPKAQGTVIASVAEAHKQLAHGSGSGGSAVTMWSPVVEFGYSVAGNNYHSARIAFGPAVSGSKEWAEAVVARYPKGLNIVVSYNPTNPAIAVLEPRVAFKWLSLAIVAGLFGAAVFFSGIWRLG